MGTSIAPAILIDAIKREKEYREAEASLMGFTKHAFNIIEAGVQFKDNWHLHAIAEHLEAVSSGEIENLVINIPPGTMKSVLVSVMWPAWEWLADPTHRYMGASYGADLAIRDAMRCRDIITSPWYKDRWGSIVAIKPGSDQKTQYELTSTGWRMATSVGGRATGSHPTRKILDDPHSAMQADSDAERLAALNWFDRTLSTRGESRGAKTVVVMQRLHQEDITGHILDDVGGYEHLCIPMKFEKQRPATSIGWQDPRSVKGSLLWPEMFNEKSVEKLEKTLGNYGAAGQLQQRPAPEGGGILKEEFFKLWPAKKGIPELLFVAQSWDTAYSDDKTINDPSAMTAWGIFQHEGKNCVLLLDAIDDHLQYPQLKKRVITEWQSTYGPDNRRPDVPLIEKKASGQSIIQELRQSKIPVVPYNPGRASKKQRAHTVAPIHETGCVYILESSVEPGTYVKWARPFVNNVVIFPNGAHDDYTDTYTQALTYLRDTGWLATIVGDEDDEPDSYADDQTAIRNPYSS